MIEDHIGILHPGEMGITVALAAKNTGFQVYWASEGRSAKSRDRAQRIGLTDTTNLSKLCSLCTALICVCPPYAAMDIAKQVASLSFSGLYIDANAISPQLSLYIGQILQEAGILYVDGAIVGPPAWKSNTTRMYLSGKQAAEAAGVFSAGPLTAKVIGDSIGRASALKMCYAAYTKGTSALLCAILAAAETLNVRQELLSEWSLSGSNLEQEAGNRVRRVAAKAWRFEGEMKQIAATFKSAGMPDGFHNAAAVIYSRLTDYKDLPMPDLEAVLISLQSPSRE